MPVVADIDADPSKRRVKTRITKIAGAKIELLPETRIDMRDMRLSIFAKVFAIGVDYRRGVVINAGLLFLVDRNDNTIPCCFATSCISLTVGPSGIRSTASYHRVCLLGTKIRHREYLLKTKHLHALPSSVLDHLHLMIDICLTDLRYRSVRRCDIMRLNQSAFDYS